MKLSARSKHGLRMMIELALNYDQGLMQIKTIAERAGISGKYIEKLVSSLKAAGLVRSKIGPAGGYTLAKPPSEINLSRIVSTLEWPIEPSRCSKHKRFSRACNECVTERIWAKSEKDAWEYFESTTLQDLIDMKK